MAVRNPRRPVDSVTCKHCGQEFRAIAWLHLRRIHGYKGPHPIEKYKHRFRLQKAFSQASRRKMSESREIFWARRGQHWTRAKLIAEIRWRQRAGKRLNYKRVPVRLYEAARRFFGTWEAARERAGLNYVEATGDRRWNQNKVIEHIRALAKEGVPLHASHIERHYGFLHRAAVRYFPKSWQKALRAAGLDPAVHRMPRGK